MKLYNVYKDYHGERLVYMINFAAGLSIFFFGYDQGVMSGVNISPDYVELMGLQSNEALLGGVVAIYYGGTLIGALIGGYIGDRVGRIRTIILGSIIAMIGAALQTSAQNIAWMICSRIITGVGTGHLNAVVPVWSAETSSHTSRGAMLAMEFTINIFGLVVAYWLAYGMSFIEGGFRWRFPIAFQIVPLIVLVLGISMFPESPRWLIKKGRTEEGLEILAALRGDGDPNHPDVVREYNDIITTIKQEENEGEPGYFSMLVKADKLNIRRRVQLSIWLQVVQELTGIAVITVYAPQVFTTAGFSTSTSQLLSGVNNITYMLGTLLPVFTLDRWGRRFTLLYGAVIQGICLILVAVLTKPEIMEINPKAYGTGATFFIFLYTCVFGMTWLTVPWLYPCEIFPTKVRAKGGAWNVVGWSIGNAFVMEIAPPMIAAIGWITFLIFGICNFLTIPMVYSFYPETSNRTLEELDAVFATRSILVWNAEKELAEKKNNEVVEYHDEKHKSLGDSASSNNSSV